MTYRKRLFVMSILDAAAISFSVWLSYALRFDFLIPLPYSLFVWYAMLGHILFMVTALYKNNMYRQVVQFASLSEVVTIIKATAMGGILFSAITWLIDLIWLPLPIPRSIYLMSWAFSILGVGGIRFLLRLTKGRSRTAKREKRKAIIVGAGSAGVMVAKLLKESTDSEFEPVGFIDDDQTKHQSYVYGLPVMGSSLQLSEGVSSTQASHIIIAIPSASPERLREIITLCKATKANVRTLPRVLDILRGNVTIDMIREVNIEDLLGREPVTVNLDQISSYLQDAVILITGAGGSIGSELCRQIANFSPRKLLLLGRGENSIFELEMELKTHHPHLVMESLIADIRDPYRIRQIFSRYRPSVVFHAAAHKHVPLMEQNPQEAISNNILGTKIVAEAAHKYGSSHFVLISTDKAVNPTSIMGASKRVAELLVQGLNRQSSTKFAAVRFGNVLGSRGSVIPIFRKQIMQGGPVTVTHPEMVRYFMTIPEAAQLVIQAGAFANGGEVFILDMGNPVNISDLAHDLIRLSGYEPDQDIHIVYTGIRPGEKLYEELLLSEEGITTTNHHRIYVGKPIEFSWDELIQNIARLEQVLQDGAQLDLKRKIQEILHSILANYQGISVEHAHESTIPITNHSSKSSVVIT